MSKIIASLSLIAACFCVGAISAEAATVCRHTFRVTKTADTADGNCSESDCSLREAVIAANECAGFNEIVALAGLYEITRLDAALDEGENWAQIGDLDVRESVRIRGGSQNTTILDGGSRSRILDVIEGTLTLDRMTLRNGRVQAARTSAYGGAVRVGVSGSLIVTNAAFTDNAALGADDNNGGWGGAVTSHGNASFRSVTFRRNAAEGGGGAVMMGWGARGTFTNVVAEDNAAWHGGALSGGAALEVATCSFRRNGVLYSGGAIHASKTVLVDNSVFVNNVAELSGGALYLTVHGTGVGTRVDIETSSFSGNVARTGSGGAIEMQRGRITNVLVENNEAGGWGGGIRSQEGNIFTSIVRRNRAQNGAGIQHDGGGGTIAATTIHENVAAARGGGLHSGGYVRLHNVTIDRNVAGELGGAVAHELGSLDVKNSTFTENDSNGITSVWISVFSQATVGHSVWSGQAAVCAIDGGVVTTGFNVETGDTCRFLDPTDRRNTTVGLWALTDNGGPKCGTVGGGETLPTRMPSIFQNGVQDHGEMFVNESDEAVLPGCLRRDARGVVRPQNGRCDIGAVEKAALIILP